MLEGYLVGGKLTLLVMKSVCTDQGASRLRKEYRRRVNMIHWPKVIVTNTVIKQMQKGETEDFLQRE